MMSPRASGAGLGAVSPAAEFAAKNRCTGFARKLPCNASRREFRFYPKGFREPLIRCTVFGGCRGTLVLAGRTAPRLWCTAGREVIE